jgi:hypothetical protein
MFETSRSINDLVNEAVRMSLLEDAEDLAAFEDRKDEPLVTYDEMIEQLKEDGAINLDSKGGHRQDEYR